MPFYSRRSKGGDSFSSSRVNPADNVTIEVENEAEVSLLGNSPGKHKSGNFISSGIRAIMGKQQTEMNQRRRKKRNPLRRSNFYFRRSTNPAQKSFETEESSYKSEDPTPKSILRRSTLSRPVDEYNSTTTYYRPEPNIRIIHNSFNASGKVHQLPLQQPTKMTFRQGRSREHPPSSVAVSPQYPQYPPKTPSRTGQSFQENRDPAIAPRQSALDAPAAEALSRPAFRANTTTTMPTAVSFNRSAHDAATPQFSATTPCRTNQQFQQAASGAMTPKTTNRNADNDDCTVGDNDTATFASKLTSAQLNDQQFQYEFLRSWLGGEEQDILKLHPDDYDFPLFQRVLNRLATSQGMKRVEVYRSWERGQRKTVRSKLDIATFFQAISNLRITTLLLWNMTESDLGGLQLSKRDGNAPTLMLGLKRIFLHFSKGTLSDPAILDGLGNLNTLEKLELQMKESFDVSKILVAPNLRWLRISSRSFVFRNKHIIELAEFLQLRRTKLQFLDLEPSLSAASIQSLAMAFVTGQSRIHTFRFSFHGQSPRLADAAMLSIANMIEYCPTLMRIVNRNYYTVKVTASVKNRVLQACQTNGDLVECRLFEEDSHFWVQKMVKLKGAENPTESQNGFCAAGASAGILSAMVNFNCGQLYGMPTTK